MNVSCIIPTWNESAAIRKAIESAWQSGAAEVIVADGGSRDDTRELAAAAGARVIATPAGRARQQNAGAREATGDVLLFLHADTRLAEDCVQQIRVAFDRQPNRWGGAFRQRIEARGWLYRCLETGNAARIRFRGVPFGDQAIFVRREIFFAAGGFPEVALMEDLILMRHLRRQAWPVLLPGPLSVSPRRWQRHGIVRQTLRNWWLQAAYYCGVSPDRLAAHYPRHAENKPAGQPSR
ncbi:MAG: TIGR04283 family arsenosugar biosynthesis glycosyltransferase [Planctomycetales bacterium]|nr:TIGR04283 family arsenosugar biosynthesis glycosyltransferase [Planctomycetales bacterium]